MAINIEYSVPVETSGQIAYDAGRGIFEQKEDAFNLQQEALDQRGSQFDRNLNYQQQLAMLKNQQFQQQQYQQDSQFNQQMQSRAYESDADRQFRLMQMGIQNQAGIAGEGRAEDRAIRGEDRQQERALSGELRAEQRGMQKQQYTKALAAAGAIEQTKNLRPEQRQQAVDQWIKQYGGMPEFDGQFPFQSTLKENINNVPVGEAVTAMVEELSIGGIQATKADAMLFVNKDGSPVYEDPKELSQAKIQFMQSKWMKQKTDDDIAIRQATLQATKDNNALNAEILRENNADKIKLAVNEALETAEKERQAKATALQSKAQDISWKFRGTKDRDDKLPTPEEVAAEEEAYLLHRAPSGSVRGKPIKINSQAEYEAAPPGSWIFFEPNVSPMNPEGGLARKPGY